MSTAISNVGSSTGAAPRCTQMWRAIAVALTLAASPWAAAAATASDSVVLDELTSPEVAARIAAGTTTVIVPIGGTEQSGPYVALGKHNARALILSERIAHALGDTLVAPVVAYVPEGSIEPPSAHMRFAGTISVPAPAFEAVLEGAARSLRRHGFLTIVLLGDHGGYQKSLGAVAGRLDREWAITPVRVLAVSAYYRAAGDEFAAALARRGFSAAEIGTHAGLADTSLTLALAPQLVRSDQLRGAPPPTVAQGVAGDPRRSSAELGQLAVDAIVADTVAAIRTARARR